MTNDKKRAKVITMIDDLYGNNGMAVVNLLTDYMSEKDWGHLYDRLEQDGTFKESKDDDTPEEMKEALDYVRENMNEIRMQEVKLAVDKAYEHHLTPSAFYNVGDTVTDLLEEYGDDNDLPEGWWENYGDIDDWLLKL